MKRLVQLEEAADIISDQASIPPLIFQLPPVKAREVLNTLQNVPVNKYPATIKKIAFTTNRENNINVYLIEPNKIKIESNPIFYIHGGGWVLGNFHTHDKLVREIAHRTNSIVIFPEYSLSPEAKFPIALEECIEVLQSSIPLIKSLYPNLTINFKSITIAGDSVGGNMATVIAMNINGHKLPQIDKQVLFYPVTNADFNTQTYLEFAQNYYLYQKGMIWFWDQYTNNKQERLLMRTSPLLAGINQLKKLPPTLIINGEADVLRDEGEQYARKLREAKVEVTQARFQAIIHDFVMLNALDQTNATRGAMDLATTWINQRNLKNVEQSSISRIPITL